MNDVVIRLAKPADRATLISLMGELHDAETLLESNRATGAESAESHHDYIESEIAKLGGTTFVAEEGGQVVGFLAYTIEEDPGTFVRPERRRHGMIWDISVSAAMRGRGLGRELVSAAEADLATKGVNEMRLYVLANNKRAQALYRELGYGEYEYIMAKRF
ncbi:MAG: GNAT family N-acetyltransferase [Rhizobiales bacterium]|nr:GNAT family N-acetyltransferase [Hyphomicrobiales bacterium]